MNTMRAKKTLLNAEELIRLPTVGRRLEQVIPGLAFPVSDLFG